MSPLKAWSRCPVCGWIGQASLGDPCPKCAEDNHPSHWNTLKGLLDFPTIKDTLDTVGWLIILAVIVLATDRVIRGIGW